MKLGLAGLLGVLLITGVLLGRRDPARVKHIMPIYFLCFLTVACLGYFGGQIVYGGKSPGAQAPFQDGQKLFENHCSGCHAHGGTPFPESTISAEQAQNLYGYITQVIDQPPRK